jgi:hypothetical protein
MTEDRSRLLRGANSRRELGGRIDRVATAQ